MKKSMKWSAVGICVLILLAAGTYKWMNARTFQLFGSLTAEVETNEKIIAITFDDGPTENTDEIIATLNDYGAQATFFLVGNEIEKHPDEMKKLIEAGHQIGNHSYSHERMIFKSSHIYRKEIERTDELIKKAGYQGEIHFRPPFGKKLIGLPWALHMQGKRTIMWSIEPDSVSSDTDEKVSIVKQKAKPGSILLLHPMYDKSGQEIKVLDEILSALSKEGYTFVTVNELLQRAGEN
ncbi:polysaccharide deacetylase family protein [Bacillus sp. KH172YL63]|uniref:polysaccharide deacetylase family protein n=1 Tax=Bacillus sp. KH172YL63 TaxID=2709784 RepID=UPI0013E48676|nr:polysaccharide deacetylase family protein [Bacillus sp. KH172YL63]BCB03679.1 polysaccharide deacetylase [Bacillus sp. KH172YL63]